MSLPVTTFPSYVAAWVHPGTPCETHSHIMNLPPKALPLIARLQELKFGDSKSSGDRKTSWDEISAVNAEYVSLEMRFATQEKCGNCYNSKISRSEDGPSFKRALGYVAKNYIRLPLSTLSPNHLQRMIQGIHASLIDPENMRGGEQGNRKRFRLLDVLGPKTGLEMPQLLATLKRQDPKAFAAMCRVNQAVENYPQCTLLSEQLDQGLVTQQDVDQIKKYFIIYPFHKDIPTLVHQMCQEIRRRYQANEDCIRIAAYVHLEYTRIHPYEDGNGRGGRLLMNLVLMQGGHQPIPFVIGSLYLRAIRADGEGFTGTFEKLVRRLVARLDYEATVDEVLNSRAAYGECGPAIENRTLQLMRDRNLGTPT